MSNIKELWAQAVEEFGMEHAHERFLIEHPAGVIDTGLSHLKVLDVLVNNYEGWEVKLKPIPDLIAHDIEFYGDNAHNMWMLVDRGEKLKPVDVSSNKNLLDDVLLIFYENDGESIKLIRKQSAALMFDVERAKAGDVVEFLNDDLITWDRCIFDDADRYDNVYVYVGDRYSVFHPDDLRMKYPPKKDGTLDQKR